MSHSGSSFEDEHGGGGGHGGDDRGGGDELSWRGAVDDHFFGRRPTVAAAGDEGLVRREPYLLAVLARFEAGQLQPYDYTRRVLAINATSSTLEMEAIVQQPPEGSGESAAASGGRLDPVDLALLRTRPGPADRSPTTRYVTLAVVFVMFAVLIGVGMWLASHVHHAALAGFGLGPGFAGVAAPW